MSDTTIIYYTDNSLDPRIAAVCRHWLTKSAGDIPIISVSQVPTDVGENICVGDIGRSWLSLYKQLFEGVRAAKTRFVATAEHDCIYSPEHFRWTPPADDTFYYNNNCWLVQWHGTKPELEGVYSYWPKRYALSQLVCNRELLLETTNKRLDVLDNTREFVKQIEHVGEPGITKVKLRRLQRWADSGRSVYLRPMLDDFAKYLESEKSGLFKTKVPNIDIRHSSNFTGPKRGRNRRRELPPWGALEEVLSGT